MEVVLKPGLSDSTHPTPPWIFPEGLLYARWPPGRFDMNCFPGSLQNPLPTKKNPDTKDHTLYDFISFSKIHPPNLQQQKSETAVKQGWMGGGYGLGRRLRQPCAELAMLCILIGMMVTWV